MYRITLGQLITAWIFGFFGWLFTSERALEYGETIPIFIFILVPFFLIFYTLGWNKARKDKQGIITNNK